MRAALLLAPDGGLRGRVGQGGLPSSFPWMGSTGIQGSPPSVWPYSGPHHWITRHLLAMARPMTVAHSIPSISPYTVPRARRGHLPGPCCPA